MQKEELNTENADIFETQEEVSQENADISRQTKLKETKLNHEEEETNVVSIEIPVCLQSGYTQHRRIDGESGQP